MKSIWNLAARGRSVRRVTSFKSAIVFTCFSLVALAAISSPATADQSPKKCDSNSIVLTPTRDKLVVRNGDLITYNVSVSNLDSQSQTACDLTNATVTLTLPAKNGTPTGKLVTLEQQVSYPAGTKTKFLGTTTYVVDVNPGVEDAVVQAEVNGTLHDAPQDHSARIIKTLGTTVTQPHTTLVKTATPVSGVAPLTVTYTYTETNDSSTDAPISDIVLTDDLCAPVTHTGGDKDGDDILDTGESWTYTCTATFTTAGVFTNHAVATGINLVDLKPHPEEFAEATVTVSAPVVPKPQIKITKEAPASAVVGESIAYLLEVSIEIDRALLDVVVTDPVCDAPPVLVSRNGGDQDEVLEWKELWVYTCSHKVTAADVPILENVAKAAGVDVAGVKTTDTANAVTEISDVKPKVLNAPPPAEEAPSASVLPFTGIALAVVGAIALWLIATGTGLVGIGRRGKRARARRLDR